MDNEQAQEPLEEFPGQPIDPQKQQEPDEKPMAPRGLWWNGYRIAALCVFVPELLFTLFCISTFPRDSDGPTAVLWLLCVPVYLLVAFLYIFAEWVYRHPQQQIPVQQVPPSPGRQFPVQVQQQQFSPPPPPSREEPLDIVVPSRIGDAKLVYHYDREKAKNVNYGAVSEMVSAKSWELGAKLVNGVIWLTLNGNPVMQLESDFRAKMLADWIQRGDPYKIYIQNVNTETKDVVLSLAFYRTVESMTKGHEYQVVKLQSYAGEDKQEAIAFLGENDELEIEDDYTDDGDEVHHVVSQIGPIGRLPRQVEKRIAEEGYYKCYVDRIDYDENDRYVPYVRIYW